MPICLNSVVCKILDRIVKANILQYLKTASIFSDAQHGFMPRRSCLTNLFVAEELITGMTDQGDPVDVVYLDFSSEIGRPPLERRYRKKRRASGLCAWTPSIPDIYK